MKIAITGGTGFIGRQLAQDLIRHGHEVVLIARGRYTRNVGPIPGAQFTPLDINNTEQLVASLRGCDAVVHCAGTSQADKDQTLEQLHVNGARSVVTAAKQAGVRKFVLVSYLNVRPNIPSRYHTTKWEGEQIVRNSGLQATILKAGLVYGPGDHLLNNLGSLFRKMPIFATVGLRERNVRLVAVEDLVAVIRDAVEHDRLADATWAVIGPEEFPFSTAARRIARAMGKPFLLVLPFPVAFQRLLAWFSGKFMSKPLITQAQVQMLADGISKPEPDSQALPTDLAPKIYFTEEKIRAGLPPY